MDSELWISRLAAGKRHLAMYQQTSQLDRLNFDDFEAAAAEEAWPAEFPCPYCYEDHDVASLCSHLEDEHPFEAKVCPICSVKIARDMPSHITLQHGHLFKLQRGRRLHRVTRPNSQAPSLLGRDLREAHLQVLLGNGGHRSSNTNASTTLADSLLSSLVLNFPTSEAEEPTKSSVSSAEDHSNRKLTPLQTWKSSCDLSHSYEEKEQKRRQATVRASFMQELLLSTVFGY